jgi:hypothetical protein
VAIVGAQVTFVLPRDGSVGVDARTSPDLVHGQRQVKPLGRPLDVTEGGRRDEDLAFVQKATCVDDQIPNYPALVIEQDVRDLPQVAIGSTHLVPLQVFQAS